MDDAPSFSPFVDGITLNPLAAVGVLVFGSLMLLLPRRWALAPLFAVTLLIAQSQYLPIGPLHFGITRLMVVFGWARRFLRWEFAGFKWVQLDIALVLWSVIGSALYVALWQTGESAIYVSGKMFDSLGMYFVSNCDSRF